MIRKHIPNIVTLLNLLCGCLSIFFLLEGYSPFLAVVFIFLGAIFDFFDGLTARLLKVQSPMGIELDSLADVVTFGVAPGFLAFFLLKESALELSAPFNEALPFVAFLIPMLSAYRLAKFNIDERQTSSFIGLPTPANALFWCGLVLMNIRSLKPDYILPPAFFDFFANHWVLTILVILFSILLVSEIPLFSLKFKNLKWADNKIRFTFLGLCIVLFCCFQLLSVSFIVILYILLSLINNYLTKKKGQEQKI